MTWPLLSNELSEVTSAENRGFCRSETGTGYFAD